MVEKVQALKNIEAVSTGQRRYIDDHVMKVSFAEDEGILSYDVDRATCLEYDISVTLGAKMYISKLELSLSENGKIVLAETKRKIGRAVSEKLYGEIKQKLYDIYYDLNARSLRRDDPLVVKVEELLEMIRYD